MPSWPVFVYGDSSRLIQAFANLIQNAAKFTERDGLLEISVAGQDGTAVIRIKDNGAGFAEHMRTTIFEAFTQVEGNVPLGQRGLGIGLRLVKTIVELHGGTVTARSEGLGQGSEFTVQLPAVDGASPVPPEVADPTAARGDVRAEAPPAHRIVVVDDDRSSAELLARMLRSIGQTVWVANDGATAIRTVLEERPQIVFLDIVMRGLDGCDVARALRGHLELDGLVLITLSGSGDEVTRRRALDAGFDKYVVKPTSIAALAEMLAGIPAAEATTGECNLAFPNFRSLGLEG
jgi:CheY-like chemotaxis protein